ncbi:metallophosphoesterase family protein [Candidatus Uabimicrobium amorphum]|uniref:Phosphoesterase n=1 Tax=Uabimicrobium amorphum TaxID=2596890 RepID=A0A5S9IQZ8_UABAM|nr:metallophosphoesterase family protein [Candidatus Uabimicrobium amorphum]BBM85075.1 phosphoesterase [Candidatus Uabimicrobium amorphum]
MKKIAIISDIHGNLCAFDNVLDDIAKRNVDAIYCLGDVVGYGPNPVECFYKAMKHCEVIIKGNHEEGVIEGPFGVTRAAKNAMLWTRKLMRPGIFDGLSRKKRIWDYLRNLPISHTIDRLLFIHGCPHDPMEYLQKQDTEDVFGEIPQKIQQAFAMVEHICFIGHTHVPGIITDKSEWFYPENFDYKWDIHPQQKIICNVGSVGQPRDRDNRSSYVTFDGETIEYHRIPYDFTTTQQQILTVPELDNYLAERLEYGR